MEPVAQPKSTRLKVSEHDARLRSLGLRPIQIWVPDVRAPSFQVEVKRQSAVVAKSEHALEDQAFIDAISVFVEP